jgi:RimJ/RimL family protein N-acetyltransferase
MKLKTASGLHIELAPFTRDEVSNFLQGFQKASITQYLHMHIAQTIETEYEWYDKVIHDQNSRLWGIWANEGDKRTLIGSTVIEQIEGKGLTKGVTGIAIVNKEYWGKGIATATHKARTWYAFKHLGLNRLISYIYEDNVPSRRAIEAVGYFLHHITRNELFKDGRWQSVYMLECLNPDEWSWKLWWGDDRPTRKSLEARKLTEAALDWAKTHVKLD